MNALKRLERLRPGPMHRALLLLLGVGWALDAMDVGLIAFTLPAIKGEFGLGGAAAGLLASAGLFGMLIGALLGGRLADLWGRATIIRSSLLAFGLGSLLTALAPTYSALLFFRVLTGLGLGAELPVAASLLGETIAARYRGRYLVWLEAFWALGWLLAAFIGYLVVPAWGWRTAFVLGALPAAYAAYLRRRLPESPRWLFAAGRSAEAARVVEHLAQGALEDPEASAPPPPQKRSFKDLFRPPLRRRTLFIALAWFAMNAGYYGAFIWLPSLLVAKGFPLVRSLGYVLLMTLWQVPGYLSAAWLLDRVGRRPVLAGYLAASAAAAWFLAHAKSPAEVLLFGSALSFFNLGAWGALYAYTPELFPTALRSSGAGLAAAVGRVGGILAPWLTGWLLKPLGFGGVLSLHAGFLLSAGIAAYLVGVETRGRPLEE